MFTIEAILADDLIDSTIQTRAVIVLSIPDRRQLSRIISFLNKTIPLDLHSLTHLKRIHSKGEQCQVIIAPTTPDAGDDIEKNLSKFDDIVKRFLDEERIVDNLSIRMVPARLPKTRQQFERASLLWPVNFHEDKYLSKCLNGTLFSTDQLKTIFDLMKQTLDLINGDQNRNAHFCNVRECKSMAAIIVKNDRSLPIVRMVSDTQTNPLRHAALAAIDEVARLHRAAKCSSTASDINQSEDLTHFADDYICTNYECFLTQDPCIMCAMALIHSRIKRVFFYDHDNDNDSAERTECGECNDRAYRTHKLHILDGLNHHYEVWKLSPTSQIGLRAEQTNDPHFPNKKTKT